MDEKVVALVKYEKPTVEIVEFKVSESIAESGDFASSLVCTEEIYG